MLNEEHYKAVLNFFYYLLLDEAMALNAAFRAVKIVQKRMKREPESSVDRQLIAAMWSIHNRYRSKRDVAPSTPPKSDWIVPRADYLVAWKEFMRKADGQFSGALVLHYVLGYPVNEIALALDLPEGTVAFRLARGLESFAKSSVLQSLVKTR